jgi:acyl-CoA oxidase
MAQGTPRRLQVYAGHFHVASSQALPASQASLVEELNKLLDHDNFDMRREMKEFMKRDIYVPRYDMDLRDERELALERLKGVCHAGFISVKDFR